MDTCEGRVVKLDASSRIKWTRQRVTLVEENLIPLVNSTNVKIVQAAPHQRQEMPHDMLVLRRLYERLIESREDESVWYAQSVHAKCAVCGHGGHDEHGSVRVCPLCKVSTHNVCIHHAVGVGLLESIPLVDVMAVKAAALSTEYANALCRICMSVLLH